MDTTRSRDGANWGSKKKGLLLLHGEIEIWAGKIKFPGSSESYPVEQVGKKADSGESCANRTIRCDDMQLRLMAYLGMEVGRCLCR